jgi:hypothetical protein
MSVVKRENALLLAIVRDHISHPVPIHIRKLDHQIIQSAHLISLHETVSLLVVGSHTLDIDLVEESAVGSLLSQEEIGHAVPIEVKEGGGVGDRQGGFGLWGETSGVRCQVVSEQSTLTF